MATLKLIPVMLRYYASLLLFLVTSLNVSAQDLLFNAPCWSNRAYFNPSATGKTSFERNSELQFSGKRQWAGIASSPQLYGLALDFSMNEKEAFVKLMKVMTEDFSEKILLELLPDMVSQYRNQRS